MPVRVYELAREFEMSNKDVIAVCREAGLDVKSHSSTIEEYEADMIRGRLAAEGGEEADDVAQETQAPPAKAPPKPAAPAVPELSPDELLARARHRVISLPTRGPVKPKAEGVKLPGRQMPPTRLIPPEYIDVLTRWIMAGMPQTAEEAQALSPTPTPTATP